MTAVLLGAAWLGVCLWWEVRDLRALELRVKRLRALR